MERLKASFVKTKRRLAERAFQAAGIHEASETAEGLAFQDALRRSCDRFAMWKSA